MNISQTIYLAFDSDSFQTSTVLSCPPEAIYFPFGEMANASTPPRFAKRLIPSTPEAGRMTKPSRGAQEPNSVPDQGLLQVIDHSARRNETESPSLPSSVSNSVGRSFSGSPMAL
jgi:hypothetical protein